MSLLLQNKKTKKIKFSSRKILSKILLTGVKKIHSERRTFLSISSIHWQSHIMCLICVLSRVGSACPNNVEMIFHCNDLFDQRAKSVFKSEVRRSACAYIYTSTKNLRSRQKSAADWLKVHGERS